MLKKLFQLTYLAILFLLTSCSDNESTILLLLKKYPINVNGRSANLYRIEQPDGTWGYRGKQGQNFNVVVNNTLDEPTAIHWHGLILPNNQDGVPFVTQEPIMPGQNYSYNFKLQQKGTYWMHSHYGLQSQKGLSAPLIINSDNKNNNYQEVIMFITDFSFKEPEVLWQELRKDMSHNTDNMNEVNMSGMKMDMPNMNHKNMQNMDSTTNDLNDVAYDAYLINYRTVENPDIIEVNPKKKVLLRIINAASASNFIINLDELKGTAIAVDGEAIVPFVASKFELAIAQRIDILIDDISDSQKAYPILAQGEGTKMQAGLVLKTAGLQDIKLIDQASEAAPALDYNQELMLQAKTPLPNKKIDRSVILDLEGNMKDYVWKINGEEWPNITPLKVKEGKRVEIILNNKSMMSHPMHLHGHVFQVTEINGRKINGAMRDTVNVLPNSTVKVQFDANNPGIWMLHCHVLYHVMGGMMTTINYEGYNTLIFKQH